MSDAAAPAAVLFDIDGTLVDSNYAHVAAWGRAAEEVGHPVANWRVHHAIGLDSGKLLDALMPGAAEAVRERASELHARYYLADAADLRLLPGARELVQEVARRGLRAVLATSAPQDELDALLTILHLDDTLTAVTSAEDVAVAKPEPDVVHAALAKAGVDATNAVLIGDTVWDAIAATRAGVTMVGLRSGGIGAGMLGDAGATAVYDDAHDLLAHLGEGPIGELLGP